MSMTQRFKKMKNFFVKSLANFIKNHSGYIDSLKFEVIHLVRTQNVSKN